MSKTITIDDDAYQLLASLKQGPADSFTKVIRRHVHKPLETAGELLDFYEKEPSPDLDLKMIDEIRKRKAKKAEK